MLETPGADLPNLFYLRTLEDAAHLQHAMFKARKEGQPHDKGRGRATIIGGGLLGVELAASLTQAGLHVDLAVSKGHPWSRFAGEATGRCVARFLENHGVTVHNADRAARLEGDGRVQRVILTSGKSIACDFAVAAAGIQIHKEILRGTPITAEKAILVDAGCRTNIREIFAAGDCAAIFDPLFGKHRMMHHWESAMQTGRIAGTNMAGGNARFESDSYFDSQVFELKIGVWGSASGGPANHSRNTQRRVAAVRGNRGGRRRADFASDCRRGFGSEGIAGKVGSGACCDGGERGATERSEPAAGRDFEVTREKNKMGRQSARTTLRIRRPIEQRVWKSGRPASRGYAARFNFYGRLLVIYKFNASSTRIRSIRFLDARAAKTSRQVRILSGWALTQTIRRRGGVGGEISHAPEP